MLTGPLNDMPTVIGPGRGTISNWGLNTPGFGSSTTVACLHIEFGQVDGAQSVSCWSAWGCWLESVLWVGVDVAVGVRVLVGCEVIVGGVVVGHGAVDHGCQCLTRLPAE